MSAFDPTLANLDVVLSARDDNATLPSLEKDWHLVQILQLLNDFGSARSVRFIFTGGTSLSKRGLITRFSEDADFLVVPVAGAELPSKGGKSSFRRALEAEIVTCLPEYEIGYRNAHDQGFQQILEVLYPTECAPLLKDSHLRPHIRLEIRFAESLAPSSVVPVQSLVAETLGLPAETSFEALDPVVIAANKLVALAWRLVRRQEGRVNNEDRNLVRHVHDLAALEPLILQSRERFVALVARVIEDDRPRYMEFSVAPEDLLAEATRLFSEDARYEEEYNRFVSRMSYAVLKNQITFAQASDAYHRIVGIAQG